MALVGDDPAMVQQRVPAHKIDNKGSYRTQVARCSGISSCSQTLPETAQYLAVRRVLRASKMYQVGPSPLREAWMDKPPAGSQFVPTSRPGQELSGTALAIFLG